LITVFGDLIRQGRLSEQGLHGLSEDKLGAIRRYAEPLSDKNEFEFAFEGTIQWTDPLN